eukprot:1140610-Rhodomonas_salina.2
MSETDIPNSHLPSARYAVVTCRMLTRSMRYYHSVCLYAIGLRARYGMSGTDLARPALSNCPTLVQLSMREVGVSADT